MTAALFVASSSILHDLDDGAHVVLDGDEGRHAASVRRVRPGEHVDITDGRGRLVSCVVESVIDKSRVGLQVERVADVPRAKPRLVVVQAIPKGERADIAVELLTEVGVDEIVPWAASRCVARWDGERAVKGRDKWQRSSAEASKQAHRCWFPDVRPLHSTSEVAALVAAATTALVLHEQAEEALTDLRIGEEASDIVVVVGPEGGISDAERETFAAAGAQVRRMGSTVMRTSTAGAVATAVLLSQTRRWA